MRTVFGDMDAPEVKGKLSEMGWEDAVVVGHSDALEFSHDDVLPQPPEVIKKIRSWLQPTNFDGEGSEYDKHLASHLVGTGSWFLASDVYKDWHSSKEHGMLWARGIPGSGKSVIAASLVNQLSQEHVPILYFFFRQIIDANHNPDAAIRDWLVQVLDFCPLLQSQLNGYLEEEDPATNRRVREGRKMESLSVSDLWQHLRTALSNLPKTYIVVDALDEMNEGQATDNFLKELFSLAQWRPSQIKILITSRPTASLDRALRRENMLHIRLEEEKIDVDISAYVRSRLIVSSIPSEYHHSIQAAVPGKANGIFLYAKLAMDALVRDGTRSSEMPYSLDSSDPSVVVGTILNKPTGRQVCHTVRAEEIEAAIQHLPTTLDIMYAQTLQEHAVKTGTPLDIQLLIMQWATHSTRPLRLIEMADMIRTTHPDQVQDLKAAKTLVRSACGPLLDTLPDETLSVVHHSLTEFLVGVTGTGLHDYPILEPGPTHNRLAIICLSYLQSGCLEAIPDTKPEAQFPWMDMSRNEDLLLAPLTKYAAFNWHIHAKKAALHGYDPGELNVILDNFASSAVFQKWVSLVGLWKHTPVTPLFMAVSLGLQSYIELIISRTGTDLQEGAPIAYAADKGYVEVIDLLVRHGANPNQYNQTGYTPLHCAAINNHAVVVSVLLQAGADVNAASKIKGIESTDHVTQHSALWFACKYGHLAVVVEMLPYLKKTKSVNDALSWAVKSRKVDIVEKILQHPLLALHDYKWKSPLHEACSHRDVSIVQILLAAGADPNCFEVQPGMEWYTTEKGRTALHALCDFNDAFRGPKRDAVDPDATKECFDLLIAAGAKVNQPDERGYTPLHLADFIATQLLIGAGSDVEATNKHQETPLHTCTDPAVARLLVNQGKADLEKPNYWGLTPLLSTMKGSNHRHGTENKIYALLDMGADISATDKHGNGPIHLAIQSLNYEKCLHPVVRRLCEAGADVNLENLKGEAPIHLVRVDRSMKESLFQILVAAGANLHPKTDTEGTRMLDKDPKKAPRFNWICKSLFEARDDELEEVYETLKSCGASLATTDDRGRTLLHTAVVSGVSRIQFLVDKGLDPKAVDYEGNTLWHEVAPSMAKRTYDRSTAPAIFQDLLRLKVDPRQPNHQGRTPLHILSSIFTLALHEYKRTNSGGLGAGHVGKTSAFDLMLGYQENLNHSDNDGVTALHFAATFSEYQTRRLLERGADPFRTTRERCNALHIAARCRKPNIVGLLLESIQSHNSGTSAKDLVNTKDILGRTPLYYACLSGSTESVNLLVGAGAEVDAVNYECSPWKALAENEQECKNWGYQPGSHDDPIDTGGVLIEDDRRPKKDQGSYDRPMFDEVITLLMEYGTSGRTFINQAMIDAATAKADYTVECLLRVRTSVGETSDTFITPEISDSIARRQAKRGENGKYCTNCKEVHTTSPRDRIYKFRDYHLLLDLTSPEERLELGREGTSLLHNFAKNGYSSALSRVITFEDTKRFEDRAWCVEQETRKRDRYGYVPEGTVEPLLLHACRRNAPNMNIIRLLVEQVGVNVNAQHFDINKADKWYGGMDSASGFRGEGPLHALVRSENWWHTAEALPYLLQHGADTELRDSRGMTALSAALDRTDWLLFNRRAVQLLVQHGADVNAVDLGGNSCLAKALFDTKTTQLLLDRGATISYDAMIFVIQDYNIELLRSFLSRGANPNVRGVSKWGRTLNHDGTDNYTVYSDEYYPLHRLLVGHRFDPQDAAQSQLRDEMIKLMFDHGASPSAEYEGTTILHELINEGTRMNLLLSTLAPSLNLEARNYAGDTALLMACHPKTNRDTSKDNPEGQTIISRLISLGADIRAQNDEGKNVLHYLLDNYYMETNFQDMELIVSSAPELINMPDKKGNTPLLLAMNRVSHSSPKNIDLLLSNGGNIHAINENGETVLHFLMKKEWTVTTKCEVKGDTIYILRRLLSLGADINAKNHAGETPIFEFFRHAKVRAVDEDAKQAPRLGAARDWTRTQDVVLPVFREVPVYDLFTELGVDWKVVSAEGETLLHVVAATKQFSTSKIAGERFKALVERGLDAGVEDSAQRTPVDVAAEVGHAAILELFRDKGQKISVDEAAEAVRREITEWFEEDTI
ncbi:ankyrin repeat-containing domain protein [Dendryphion nanum]|uniref:Ankyrin repeat-containing domain protein n=1 Tax=Dendryphion nanum TaxID=256645 RepID=A0A9P9I7M8_9PLEO|nr:ankyrin repeat-containing domain protein [Dendryphion nanum]